MTTPERLQPEHIEGFLAAMRTLLYDQARSGRDLRIAQVVGNLGDNYYTEDAEYVAKVWEACD